MWERRSGHQRFGGGDVCGLGDMIKPTSCVRWVRLSPALSVKRTEDTMERKFPREEQWAQKSDTEMHLASWHGSRTNVKECLCNLSFAPQLLSKQIIPISQKPYDSEQRGS